MQLRAKIPETRRQMRSPPVSATNRLVINTLWESSNSVLDMNMSQTHTLDMLIYADIPVLDG